MGAFYEEIPQSLISWLLEQKIFWVATAPLAAPGKANGGHGHINVSPKGGPYFGILSRTKFWYMDLTGSGNETICHLNEPGNGRITVLFNGFDGPPRIIRLWGHGTVLENGTPAFKSFVQENKVDTIPGTRTIIIVDIHQVGTSCGFSVPFYDFKEFRPVLNDFFRKKEERHLAGKVEDDIDRYWAFKNAHSMDGLPGMKRGLWAQKEYGVAPIKKMVGPLAPKNQLFYGASSGGFGTLHLFLVLLIGLIIGFGLGTYGFDAQQKLQSVVVPMLEQARTKIARVNIAIPSPAQILKK